MYRYRNSINRHIKNLVGEENMVSNPLLDAHQRLKESLVYEIEYDKQSNQKALNDVKELFDIIDKHFK